MTRPLLILFAPLIVWWSSTLAGCDMQPTYVLVMTTYDEHGFVSTQTLIQGSEAKRNVNLLAINGANQR